MRSLPKLKTYTTKSAKEVQICIAPPHQFVLNQRQQLLPGWNVLISYLILLLQQSSISLKESSPEVALEKDALRAKFMLFGRSLIFALQAQEYQSDLFDPRTGYPLFARPGITFDDNAVVKAMLKYPVISYRQCSLLIHPVWGNKVYPSTIVTSAPANILDSCLQQAIANQNWQLKN